MHRVLLLFLLLLSISAAQPVFSLPAAQAEPTIATIEIGLSAQGRPITALRIGDGPRKLVLVGNTHGFPEANTYVLATLLADHFRANPQEVPPSVRLYIIPTLNPDGLALGTRFNARGVDLNRNMNTSHDACGENDWQVTVQGAYGVVSDTGGPYADSEVETRLIRDFLLDASAVIFFHSNAGNVFPAACEHPPSIALAQQYAAGAGYSYARYWEAYTITGGMHDWAGSMGIAAIIPELITGQLPEFEQNIGGVRAVLAQADELLPPLADLVVEGQAVPAPIWRFWRMHGGAERFGPPLTPPQPQADGRVLQYFTNALLTLDPQYADTPYLVQAAPLGSALTPPPGPQAPPPPDARVFAETGQAIYGAFGVFWEIHGGVRVFGFPISGEYRAIAADGQRRIMQRFERAVFAYYPEDDRVRLEPLGWADLARARAQDAVLPHNLR
jgi:predicted deacylase